MSNTYRDKMRWNHKRRRCDDCWNDTGDCNWNNESRELAGPKTGKGMIGRAYGRKSQALIGWDDQFHTEPKNRRRIQRSRERQAFRKELELI